MKGIIFTEFLELVEQEFGFMTTEQIIEACNLPSGGAYTSVGTYDHQEIVQLVVALSERVDIPVDGLLKIFGKYLFGKFGESYAHFFKGMKSSFDLLERIDNYIHPEVLKLYPDAKVPHFDVTRKSEDVLEMIYHSERKMADCAEGLIEGCFVFFKEDFEMERVQLDPEGTQVKFLITKKTA